MRITLLVVESNSKFLDLFKQHASTKEWKIYGACTLKEIRQCFGRNTIDVILLNLVEMKHNGIGILKKIRKKSIPVITINSGNQLSLSIEAMKMGVFDDFLMPLNLDALLEKIHEASKEKIKAKSRFPLIKHLQNSMIAATYAEAGEAEMAKTFLSIDKLVN
jgi:DNA-binding NtrC family response regulator